MCYLELSPATHVTKVHMLYCSSSRVLLGLPGFNVSMCAKSPVPITIHQSVSSRHLRSVNQHQLTVPRCRRITFDRLDFSLLWARRSGTHYRLSFVVCLSVLTRTIKTIYYSRDIGAFGTIDMQPWYCTVLYISYILLYSIMHRCHSCGRALKKPVTLWRSLLLRGYS